MRTLLTTELDVDRPGSSRSCITTAPRSRRFIVKAIADMLAVVTLAPLRKALP